MSADLINPDMPAQQLRLHMGEMTAQEMRTARAAIRWANTAAEARIPSVRAESVEECARVAEAMPPVMRLTPDHVTATTPKHVAQALRGLAPPAPKQEGA